MTIFRGGGGSTNITYVAIRAAAQTPRIQTQAATARLRRLRGPAGGTTGRDEESTTRSPEYRWGHGRTLGRWRGTAGCRFVGRDYTRSGPRPGEHERGPFTADPKKEPDLTFIPRIRSADRSANGLSGTLLPGSKTPPWAARPLMVGCGGR